MSALGILQDVSRPHIARLVRISSSGSSIDSGDPHEYAPYTPNHGDEVSSTDDQVMEDTVSVTAPDETNDWIPVYQDLSQASESEIQQIEAAGEHSALDHTYWENKTFHSSGNNDLLDPAITTLSSGRIDWLINNFNGSRENPNTRFIMTSPWVFVGKYSWRIKLYPKGKESSYLSVYLECNFPEDDACETLENPSPLIDNISLTRPRHLPASFSIVVWNPQEPRVYLSAATESTFTAKQPDAGWARFGSSHARDLGRRQPGQRQALLRNDTLAFTAYIRTYQDPTGSLFFNMNLCSTYNSFTLTGMNAISSDHTRNNNLGAAIAAWIALVPFQDMLRSITIHEWLEDPKATPAPLLCAFLTCMGAMVKRQGDDGFVVRLAAFDSALGYYGASFSYGSDIFKVWEVLRDILEVELQGTPYAGALRALWEPIGFRCKLPLSTFHNFTRVTEAMHEFFLNSRLYQTQHWPKILQVELPRYNFDRTAREWRIMSDKIILDRKFMCDGLCLSPEVSYSLCGLITYKGSLDSGFYETLMRSPRSSTWYKFSNINGGRVELRTTKQALQDHCSATYVLVYVRDNVPAIVSNTNAESANQPADLTSLCSTVDLDVFHSDVFIGRRETGIVDILDRSSPASSNFIRKLRVEKNATLSQIKQELTGLNTINYEDLRLWVMVTYPRSAKVWTPKFHRLDGDIWTAERIVYSYPRCPLWLHIGKVNLCPDIDMKIGAGDVGVPAPDSTGNTQSGTSYASYDVIESGPETAPGLPTGVTLDGAANTVQDIIDDNHGDNHGDIHDDDLGDDLEDDLEDDLDEEMENESVESGDVRNRTIFDHITEEVGPQKDLHPHAELGFFLKIFDPLTQSLTGKAMLVTPRTASIKLTIEHLMGWQNEQPGYFIEQAPNRADDLGALDVVNGIFSDGMIIIAMQTELSDEVEREVRASGGIAHPNAFLRYLCMTANHPELLGNSPQSPTALSIGLQGSEVSFPAPSLGDGQREPPPSSDQEVVTESNSAPGSYVTNTSGGDIGVMQERYYFLGEYYRGTFSRGYYHGQGHHIDKEGNEYFGNFAMGLRSGKGHLTFRNGDTYAGDWQDDEMHGNGTYVTQKTGNTYQGGFRDGSRYGRGITKWVVAHKDESTCRICYERPPDCAFCDCGHVCACYECALKLSRDQGCPVCRGKIAQVMKLYF